MSRDGYDRCYRRVNVDVAFYSDIKLKSNSLNSV